jgi:hypothetical protein
MESVLDDGHGQIRYDFPFYSVMKRFEFQRHGWMRSPHDGMMGIFALHICFVCILVTFVYICIYVGNYLNPGKNPSTTEPLK